MELWTDKGRRVSMPARSAKSELLTRGMLRLEGLRQRLILPSNWRDGGEARQRRAWEDNTLPYEVKREPTSTVGQANLRWCRQVCMNWGPHREDRSFNILGSFGGSGGVKLH